MVVFCSQDFTSGGMHRGGQVLPRFLALSSEQPWPSVHADVSQQFKEGYGLGAPGCVQTIEGGGDGPR